MRLSKEQIDYIASLRLGNRVCTYRRVSELFCEKFPDTDQTIKGMQFHGEELVESAFRYLELIEINDAPESLREKWYI